jgi:acetyl esterase/lipase
MNGMRTRVLSLVASVFVLTLLSSGAILPAHAQLTVLPLWPHGTPEPPLNNDPEIDTTKPTDALFHGKPSQRLTNVSKPTMSVYLPAPNRETHVAALVFPGGGYARLAWNGEGTDTCDWLTSIGVACLLVKYRVPQPPGAAGHYPADFADLEDAQQAMRLARQHAPEWHINRDRIGVVGFSAGGNLAVLLSTHPDDPHVMSTPAKADVPTINGTPRDAYPNFAIVVYPAYLAVTPEETALDPTYTPNKFTPPTFLIQAENDKTYGRNALVYYRALMNAGIQAELHYYATGGHGFGIHPTGAPEEHWTDLATLWLHYTGIIPHEVPRYEPGASTGMNGGQPCPVDTNPPVAGTAKKPNPNPTDNPCLPQ